MPIFTVTSPNERFMISAARAALASAYVRRRRGTDGGPYRAKKATAADVREHMEWGGMVLRTDGGIMPRADAEALIILFPPPPPTQST